MHPEIGQNYYVWGVDGNKWVGKVIAVGPHCVHLVNCSWVANDGGCSVFCREGKADNMEIEPVGENTVLWANYIKWPHPLFDEAV